VALRYDAPALGALDLRFDLHPSGLAVTVTVAGSSALALAQAQAPALRETLARTSEKPVTVTVRQRRQPLDVYA
jgi:hypothetical protein